jgi:hypothetical protein
MTLLSGATVSVAVALFAWVMLSTSRGDLEPPNPGRQQTASAVFDIDGDGVNDFVIAERTQAPAVVWYRRHRAGWHRHVLEPDRLAIEAGATFGDVDGDGDLDFIAAGDHSSNGVWWWENPRPSADVTKPWPRRAIKSSGASKHHDLLFVDADSDGRNELIFWNQGAQALFLARPPADVRSAEEWQRTAIYNYSKDSEMPHRGKPPGWRAVNEHEGLAFEDIDLDGKRDIVGGGRWFRHLGGDRFRENLIDASFPFSRCAAAQFIEGGRPEIVLSLGDGVGPLILYEWGAGVWHPRTLQESIDNGHTLQAGDFNFDGHADLFLAEMRLNGANPRSKMLLLFGDGKGNFREEPIAEGYDNHESKMADLDGDGTFDILGKPYNHGVPGLNIWLHAGGLKPPR